MKRNFKRMLSILIILALVFVSVPVKQSTNYVLAENTDVEVVKHSNGDLEAIQLVEGSEIRTVYQKETNTYTLYREDASYVLNVYEEDGEYVVGISDLVASADLEKVNGQYAMALPLVYWSAPYIAGAMATIKTAVVVSTGVVVTWFAVDSIAKTISDTKVRTSTAPPKTQPVTAYYFAKISNGKVNIGTPTNFLTAVTTVKLGLDIFATSSSAAQKVAAAASSTIGLPKHHLPHGGDGYYPHWHPIGVKWAYNPKHAPHCWYGPAK